MKMRSKNTGAQAKSDNPFLVNDPATLWEEWKQKGKPVSREELERKMAEATQLQKQQKRK
jgi:hypothetical protein